MLRFVQRQKGAISIFLLVVLVPIMILASMMIDSARIRLARAVAESAGDLALNTALSQYDNVLKDMYGLFAVSQTEKELFNNLESYYKNSLKAAGLSDETATDYVGSIMKTLCSLNSGKYTDEEASDLLRISLASGDKGFQAEGPEKGNLVNPALLKEQLVNFMKYRAPIEAGLGFMNSLKCFTTLSDQMKVVEDRNEYYKEQQKVVDICEEIWKDIDTYNKLEITEEKLKERGIRIDNYASAFLFFTRNAVMDYHNAKEAGEHATTYFDYRNHTYMDGTVFRYKGKMQKDFGNYSASSPAGDLGPFVIKLSEAKANFERVVNAEKNVLYRKTAAEGIYPIQQVIQFITDSYKDENNSYAYLMKEYYLAYNRVVKAEKSLKDAISSCRNRINDKKDEIASLENSSDKKLDGTPVDHSGEISRLESEIDGLEAEIDTYNARLDTGKGWKETYGDKYTADFQDFKDMTKRMLNEIKTGRTSVDLPNVENGTTQASSEVNNSLVSGSISDTKLEFVSEYFLNLRKLLEQGKGLLTTAAEKLGEVKVMVAPGGSLYQKLEFWSDSAGKTSLNGEAMTEQNREEIKTVKEFISEKEVNDLKVHLEQVEVTLEDLIKEIDGYTYGDTYIYEIKDIEALFGKINAVCGSSFGDLMKPPLKTEDLKNLCEKIFKKCYKEPYPDEDFFQKDQFTCEWEEEPWKSPELMKEGNHNDYRKDYNKFYVFLQNNFESTTKDDTKETVKKRKEEVKEKKDALKETRDDQMDEVNKSNASGEKINFGERPSRLWKNEDANPPGFGEDTLSKSKETNSKKDIGKDANVDSSLKDSSRNLSGMFQGLVGCLGNLAGSMAVTLRDDLYLSTYIREMFSFDTVEKEAIYDSMAGSQDRDRLLYMQSAAMTPKAEEKLKTLTQIPISKDYNNAYRSEVEYIIYGKESSKTNHGLAYASIFGIRFAFNTIYAITDKDIRNGAGAIATAVCQPPPLTLAQPLVKYAIIIGIAIAESALDMLCLQAGMKVPLYKNEKTWQISFQHLWENLAGAAKSVAADTAKSLANKAIKNGENVLQDWLNKGDEEIQGLIDQGGEDVSKNISELENAVVNNINEAISKYAGTAMDQLSNLCQKANNLLVTAGGGDIIKYNGREMTKEEFVTNELRAWLGQEKPDGKEKQNGKAYEAKKIAVDYIINRDCITTMFQAIESVTGEGDRVTLATELKNKINKMQEDVISECKSKLKGYVEKAKDAVSGKVSAGAESLRKEINKTIDDWAGDSGMDELASNAGSGNTSASFFSFQYSDYLQLFLVIGLIADQEGVILRTGDMISANMILQNKGFKMSKAYTYVKIDATLEVKPVLMYLPFMNDLTNKKLPGTKWYTIQYHGMQGYY